ncbi:hypothetical protein [Brevundimonas sp. Root1279]|uniref:hypothetical protein n=1 Tax=Brevundimonas sp. Root1279 TaxID=1736443 RepID=UPI0007015507|nr:hypothetical protein [Brevundimonas sp. Root1279]KQW82952.1 hypothetical protein ASC65_06290 [Brevundimonas sp. Root1279]
MSVHDQLLALAGRRAQEILALPPDQREAQYVAMRAEHRVKANALGMPGDAVEELVEEMEDTVRNLVARTEESGPDAA